MCDIFSCRLKIAKGVVVNKLLIRVNSSDSSYMPERVVVMGCYTTTGKQHTLKETTIPLYDFVVCFYQVFLVICWHFNAIYPACSSNNVRTQN